MATQYSNALTERSSVADSHHPAIRAAGPVTVLQPPGFFVDFIGALTRCEFTGTPAPDADNSRLVTSSPPQFDEEYFEWIDLLEAVADARDQFVMFELGAGYGRWSVRGAAAARAQGLTRIQCVAVEGEPTHFRWLRQHFRDNGLNPEDHELIWAAVDASGGFVPFKVGQAADFYGQRITRDPISSYPDARARRRLLARSVLGRPPAVRGDEAGIMWVPAVTLAGLLAPYSYVDLVDMDIQRNELAVIRSSIDQLDERVRRIHIGTHSNRIEAELRDLFLQHGWLSVHDYARRSTARTPYGDITFQDGVQSWLNPRLAPTGARPAPPAAHPAGHSQLELRIETLRARTRQLYTERQALRERVRTSEAAKKSLRREVRRLTARIATLDRRVKQLTGELRAMSRSISWRLTAPLRRLRSLRRVER